ncbi:MAG: hypothetical protein ACTSVV_17915 [Promethearchaeota archaeon]
MTEGGFFLNTINSSQVDKIYEFYKIINENNNLKNEDDILHIISIPNKEIVKKKNIKTFIDFFKTINILEMKEGYFHLDDTFNIHNNSIIPILKTNCFEDDDNLFDFYLFRLTLLKNLQDNKTPNGEWNDKAIFELLYLEHINEQNYDFGYNSFKIPKINSEYYKDIVFKMEQDYTYKLTKKLNDKKLSVLLKLYELLGLAEQNKDKYYFLIDYALIVLIVYYIFYELYKTKGKEELLVLEFFNELNKFLPIDLKAIKERKVIDFMYSTILLDLSNADILSLSSESDYDQYHLESPYNKIFLKNKNLITKISKIKFRQYNNQD